MGLKESKKIAAFVELSSVPYHSMPSSDEHESEHNYSHKKAWGRAGVAALKALTVSAANAMSITGAHHNWSGSIDRGQVSAFISNYGGTKHVYVHIGDSPHDAYCRTANDTKDYTGGQNRGFSVTERGFEGVAAFIHSYFEA